MTCQLRPLRIQLASSSRPSCLNSVYFRHPQPPTRPPLQKRLAKLIGTTSRPSLMSLKSFVHPARALSQPQPRQTPPSQGHRSSFTLNTEKCELLVRGVYGASKTKCIALLAAWFAFAGIMSTMQHMRTRQSELWHSSSTRYCRAAKTTVNPKRFDSPLASGSQAHSSETTSLDAFDTDVTVLCGVPSCHSWIPSQCNRSSHHLLSLSL